MHAIKLLEKQHDEVMKVMTQLEESEPGRERAAAFKLLQSSLVAHMVIEEELFYPAVAQQQKAGEPIAEGYEEHAGARGALQRCERALKEEELFQVRIGVLKEMIKHHVGEERNEIFPRAKKIMAPEDFESLGTEMEERFNQALKGTPANVSKLNRMATTRAISALEAGEEEAA